MYRPIQATPIPTLSVFLIIVVLLIFIIKLFCLLEEPQPDEQEYE